MRKLPVAIIVSMISHAAAIAWVVRDGDVLAVPLRAEPAAATSPPVDLGPATEPVVVVLLDEPSTRVVVAAAASPGGTADRARRGRPAISTGGASGNEVSRGEPARSPWLTMRGPEKPRIGGMSGSFLEDFLARSKPLAP